MSGRKTLSPPGPVIYLCGLALRILELILKERRLRWYGHVERSSVAIKTAFDIQVDGKRGPGRPKMTWKQLTEKDCREWKLSAINPHDRRTWRSVGWSGGAKVSCILRHRGVQLILAYSWARPAILVAGKGRWGIFLFLLFLHFHSCSFLPCPSL